MGNASSDERVFLPDDDTVHYASSQTAAAAVALQRARRYQKYYTGQQAQPYGNPAELFLLSQSLHSDVDFPSVVSTSPPQVKRARVGEQVWSSLPDVSPREENQLLGFTGSNSTATFRNPLTNDSIVRFQGNELNSSCWSDMGTDEPQKQVLKAQAKADAGPITNAVMEKGLKAKMKSFSAWVVSPRSSDNLQSTSAHSGLHRWASLKAQLRSSVSLTGSLKIPRKEISWHFPKLGRVGSKKGSIAGDSVISNDRASVNSVNSLSDGRTPWPVPWLEAIFLPDFPNRGRVSEKDFKILGTIAKGAFGRVYRVCLKNQPDTIYAMKVQKKSEVISQEAVDQVKQEVAIHYQLCHSDFVAQLHYAWQNRTSLYMVLHYVSGYGDLYQLWRDEGSLNEEAVSIIVAELALALDYIHNSSIIYRDMKMENVMLDDNGHVQLVDFGLAKWLTLGDRTKTICGTLQYMAPEIVRIQPYGHEVDWWSLGVLMHTLLTGKYPFVVGHDHHSVNIPDYHPPGQISRCAQVVIAKLLIKEPKFRLQSLTELRTDPFFDGLDFDLVLLKKLHPFDVIPRMRRCDTCNIETDINSVLGDTAEGFEEGYDMVADFDFVDV